MARCFQRRHMPFPKIFPLPVLHGLIRPQKPLIIRHRLQSPHLSGGCVHLTHHLAGRLLFQHRLPVGRDHHLHIGPGLPDEGDPGNMIVVGMGEEHRVQAFPLQLLLYPLHHPPAAPGHPCVKEQVLRSPQQKSIATGIPTHIIYIPSHRLSFLSFSILSLVIP